MQSVEGTEDDYKAGVREADRLHLILNEVVIGLAKKSPAPLLKTAEIGILIKSGAEIIAGPTRMKASTVQKITFNVLSTAILTRVGLVCQGRMVAMHISKRKLLICGKAMVFELTGCAPYQPAAALDKADRSIRLAILVIKGWTLEKARADLDQ